MQTKGKGKYESEKLEITENKKVKEMMVIVKIVGFVIVALGVVLYI